jgi:hypothetical protein
MPTTSLHEITARLNRVFDVSDHINDDEIKSHLARYLCVLTSGYLEEAIKILIRDFVSGQASPTVRNHINSTSKNLSNLNIEKIGQYLNSYNGKWKDQFDTELTDEEKDAVNSIITNRHSIAHGVNVSVSYSRIKAWHIEVIRVIEKIQKIINS